jgi:hypothetical protein
MRLTTFYFILLTVFAGSEARAQEDITISGIVTTFNSIPLNHVTIKSLKAGNTVNTDSLGKFMISCRPKDKLLINASGFDGKRLRTKKPGVLKIDLVYSNKEGSLANAVNGNHISEEILKEAINTHPAKGEKDYSIYSNIYELIDNEIHNVTVNGRSVLTKKVQTLNLTKQVLYIVDGVETTDISYIYPFNVKSIRYSDGVDASMYGIRGANGVILITLKN